MSKPRAARALVGSLALLVAAGCGGERAPGPAGPSAAGSSSSIAIVGVTVIHPGRDGAAAQERDRTVLVQGDRITAVGPAASTPPPAGARVIDGRGRWLIPGLIDSHVHFFQSGNPFTRPDAADFTSAVPYADEVARNKARLPATFKVWLASGVTSVLDCGGPMWNFDMRDQARRTAAAPRVEVAGPLVSLIDRPPLALDDPPIIKVTSPEEARALVARELPRHPDFIKMWFIHLPTGDLVAEEAIARAAAEAAHAAGLRFLVHATELEVAKAALRAGADILVHSVFDRPVDDEFIALAAKRRAILIPTLWVTAGYAAVLGRTFEPTEEERRLADPEILAAMSKVPHTIPERASRTVPAAAMESLPRLWAAGITVALGTDAGNIGTLHGPSVFREARLMVQAGLTPAQVLRSATVNGARALGLEDQLGDVAVGKRADLVLLDADPLLSVDNLSRARVVVRAGQVFDPAQLMTSIR
ncbi:MAG TPA: amidohydrolase family protein [Kofleriaceae bacterium]|nr:amidohydrolase family protein [Kofleriaceae bacterium]